MYFIYLYPQKVPLLSMYLGGPCAAASLRQPPSLPPTIPPSLSVPLTHAFGSHRLPCRLVASRVRACLQTGQTRPLLWDKHKTQTSINKQIHSYTPLPQKHCVHTQPDFRALTQPAVTAPLFAASPHCLVRNPVHFCDLVSLLIDGVRESPASPSDKALA